MAPWPDPAEGALQAPAQRVHRHGSEPLPEVIRLRLIAAGIVLGILVLCIHGFTSGNRFVLFGLAALPIGILLVNRSNWWFVITIGVLHSWLYIPGFPTALSLFHSLAIGIIPVMIARRCIERSPLRSDRYLNGSLIALGVVALITMCIRGFGLRFLGGDEWGGSTYLHLYATILFFIACDKVVLDEFQCKVMLVMYFAAGILPAISEFTYLLSRGAIYHFYYFVRPDGSSLHGSLEVITSGGGLLRFQSAKQAMTMFALALALFPLRGRGIVIIAGAALVAVLAAGISGHRDAVVYLVLLVPTLMYLTNPEKLPSILAFVGVAAIVTVIVLCAIGTYLPLPFQRAVSWVPFVPVEPEARWAAEETLIWRLELWDRALAMLDQFWLLGRGVTFHVPSIASRWTFTSLNVEYAIITHNYHSGPITLWVDLGIFGLLFGSMFLIYAAVRHTRFCFTAFPSEFLQRAHRVVLATYLVQVFRFYFIHGDLKHRTLELIVHVALLEALRRAPGASAPAPADNPESLYRGV